MKMGTQTLSLNWSNHKSNMSTVFQQLFSAKAFVDVTIVCDGLSLKAHKMVLSASSPLFRRLLLENPCQHPIVIMTDITYADMEALLGFMYRGEIDVTQEKLSQFLRTAEKLKIKGLSSSDSNTSIYKQSNPEEQITAHPSDDCLITCLTEPNATNNTNLERDVLSIKSNNSLEMDRDQERTSAIKLEDSFENSECLGSERNSNNDQCWRNSSSDLSISANKPCATELAKSTISCLRHWEGLTNGKPSYIENQINSDNSNVQQEASSVSENLPMVSDDDDLQDQIFPPSIMQQTMERTSLEDIHLSKAEHAEEESFEFNKERNFESSSDYTAKTKQVESEKIDNEENVLPEVDESQNVGSSMDIQLANNSNSKEPCEYNPHLACDVCKKSFEDLKRLCLHRRSHNREQGPFTCATCGKTFGVKSRFRCHLRTHSGKRPFCCSICNKAFLRNEHLQDHLRIHSGEKPFSCAICEKKFITKGHLTIHSRSHTGEKPYVCDFCQKKFVKSSDLMTHLRVHTGEKPYTCNVCGKRFARTANMKTHASRAHSTEFQPTANWL